MFDPIKPNITEHVMDQVFDVYRRLKSDGEDKKSADYLVTLVPGPAPNCPENKNVASVVRFLKKNLMATPKVGRIEFLQYDVLQRVRSPKFSFSGQADNYMVFASEKKTAIARKSLTFLGGDSHFNKWVVPLIPLASLHRVDVATQKAMFAEQDEVGMDEVDDTDAAPAVDMVLGKDQMIPFPQDWADSQRGSVKL